MSNEDDDIILEGAYNTEHEAAYAYNVGMLLLAPITDVRIALQDLNLNLELTQSQVTQVETDVCKQIRSYLKLPKNYKFPRQLKEILSKTYKLVE